MSYPLSFVKEVIESFVNAQQSTSIILKDKKNDGNIKVNKSIFHIESFLVDLRQQFQLNNRLDTSIVSDHVLEHFESIAAEAAFKPPDYQLNFLYHLACEYEEGADLFSLIDSFVDKFKNQFVLADIVITKTGATRCKTNIRFAINDLRNLGFVLSKDENDERTWAPSILGMAVLLNIQMFADEYVKSKAYNAFHSLLTETNQRLSSTFRIDPILIQSIQQFKEDAHIYRFLSKLNDIEIPAHNFLLRKITTAYIEFVQEGLEISTEGVRMTKQFKQLSAAFQRNLLLDEKGNEAFRDTLRNHLKRCRL